MPSPSQAHFSSESPSTGNRADRAPFTEGGGGLMDRGLVPGFQKGPTPGLSLFH